MFRLSSIALLSLVVLLFQNCALTGTPISQAKAAPLIVQSRMPASTTFYLNGPLKEANEKVQAIIDENASSAIKIVLCGNLEFSKEVYLKSNLEITGCTDSTNARKNKISAQPNSDFKAFFTKAYGTVELENVTISNLIVEGSRGDDFRKSVYNFINLSPHSKTGVVNKIKNLKLERNSITKFYQTAILLYKTSSQQNSITFNDIYITNNYIADIYSSMGIFINDGIVRPLSTYDIPNRNIKIKNNTIYRIGAYAPLVNPDNAIAGFGVLIVGARDIDISSNTVKWFKEEAIRVNESAVVYVSYNTIEESLTIDDYPGGIKLNRVTNASVWKNSVSKTEKSGIEILGGNQITIYSNYLAFNKNHAIRISDNSKKDLPDFITQNILVKPNQYHGNTGENVALIGDLAKASVQKQRNIIVE